MKIDGFLCQHDLEEIANWEYSEHVHPQDDMTDLGRHELLSLGERLRETFPEALKVDPDNVKSTDFVVSIIIKL